MEAKLTHAESVKAKKLRIHIEKIQWKRQGAELKLKFKEDREYSTAYDILRKSVDKRIRYEKKLKKKNSESVDDLQFREEKERERLER